MPLPHFTQLQSTNTNFEPVYPSLFEVTFVLPQILQAQGRDPLMLLENAKKIDLSPLTPDIPAVNSQRFKFSTRVFLALPEKTDIEFDIPFNVNVDDNGSVFVWNTLRAWYDLVWNSQNGTTFYKRDIIGTVIVNQHDKKGFVIRRVTFHNAQLKAIEGFADLDWTNTSGIVEDVNAKFVADYWTDEFIDNSFEIVPPNVYPE
jgi:hypothetical protein